MNFCRLFLLICILSCREEKVSSLGEPFDIFVIMGQSNTENGEGFIAGIDDVNGGVLQLGRHGNNNMAIMVATEPLENWDPRQGKIGFGLAFAKLYTDSLLEKGRRVLLIPCGKGNSGFKDMQWNKGMQLYNDAVKRSKWVLDHFPGSRLKAILWQQGELDVGNPLYKEELDGMISSFRQDMKEPYRNCIFLAGGMVPFWVSQDSSRMKQQDIIRTLPARVLKTGYVDPESPFIIKKMNDTSDAVHYDAIGQRELARRYFQAYRTLAD